MPTTRAKLNVGAWTWPHDACHLWEEISSFMLAVQSALFRGYTERAV
jgi:hypothetical protein